MSSGLKKLLSFLLIAFSITAVVFIAFSNEDLSNAWDAIKQMNLVWLACIFACWLLYTVCDGMNYWFYLRGQGFKISIGSFYLDLSTHGLFGNYNEYMDRRADRALLGSIKNSLDSLAI